LLGDDRACGVAFSNADGSREQARGRAVVLATGGIGALFAQTSNPPDADGSGLALALAAGAALRDPEFVQFHPTALLLPGQHSLPLVTEALRGAGARLHDGKGRRLMEGVHPLGDLAPRDVVAREVWKAVQHGGAVLDARMVGAAFAEKFPTVLRACLDHGIDPRVQPIPVVPAAHFHMGGIATDIDSRSTRPGLYAVGEVACNGVHGANRLASNSLLEGLVFGRRLGAMLRERPDASGGSEAGEERRHPAPLDAHALASLRNLMARAMGPLREGAELQQALRDAEGLASGGWQGGVAHALIGAALARKQSLGAHFRTDSA